jgi:hypothetical protein
MSASRNQLSQQEKARRWDELIGCLRQPGMRETYIYRLSGVRRAVYLLLADESLPPALAAELNAYRVKVDALYLEAADGFSAIEGVLNFVPTYVTESVTGEICADDTNDRLAVHGDPLGRPGRQPRR